MWDVFIEFGFENLQNLQIKYFGFVHLKII